MLNLLMEVGAIKISCTQHFYINVEFYFLKNVSLLSVFNLLCGVFNKEHCDTWAKEAKQWTEDN